MTVTPVLTTRGAATRQRILDAATAEFAQYGLAGSRIDRIVEQARTNKAQLYGYFGSKEQLFDTIFEASLTRILTVDPVDASDLAEWAVRLYDQGLAEPDLIRLAAWYRLERRPAGELVAGDDGFDRSIRQAISRAQRAGAVIEGKAFDVLAIAVAMAMTWSPVSTVYAASAEETAATHAARRRLLRRAVEGALAGPRG